MFVLPVYITLGLPKRWTEKGKFAWVAPRINTTTVTTYYGFILTKCPLNICEMSISEGHLQKERLGTSRLAT
jgi:hypothetical protein